MKTRNEKQTFVKSLILEISFNVGSKTIKDKINIDFYIRTFEKYSISSTGRAGYTLFKENVLKFAGMSLTIPSNCNEIKDYIKKEIIILIASNWYNCGYNRHLKKFFKKSL